MGRCMAAAGASLALLAVQIRQQRRSGGKAGRARSLAVEVATADPALPDVPFEEDLLGERVDFILRGQPSLRFQHRRLLVEDCLSGRPRPRGVIHCGGRPGDVPATG